MQTLNLHYIKSRRHELDKSLQDLADDLGFKSNSTYLKYETGAYAFKANQLPTLAKSLNCKITDFFIKNVSKIEI